MPKILLQTDEDNLPPSYVAATRIDYNDYNDETLHEFIKNHCIEKGKPLVVSNMNTSASWNEEVFTLDSLKKYRGDMDLTFEYPSSKGRRVTVKLGEFVTSLQRDYDLECHSTDYSEAAVKIERIYAKDVLCPNEYRDAMGDFVPEYLLPHGSNDLFGSLPDRFKAENLMCYLGQDATGTPIHRDLCGTMGHNIMTMASPGGFAEWYIVEHQQRDELAAILEPTINENKRTNRHDRIKRRWLFPRAEFSRTKSSYLESDRAWLNHYHIAKSGLLVQVIIQKPGDLVIVPSRAYHQVRNQGVSVKIAWNRITPQTLAYAFEDQLPLYRIIGRPEIYKCKGIVAFTIYHWKQQLWQIKSNLFPGYGTQMAEPSLLKYGVDVFLKNAKTLLDLYLEKVILPEVLYGDHEEGIITDGIGEVCTVQCDFCHSDVFYRYYHCDKCDHYDLCLDCYAMGRSCEHVDGMEMHQSPTHLGEYIKTYIEFVQIVNELFNTEDIIDRSQAVLQNTSDRATNLATACKRIERYRRLKGKRLNALKCSHCSKGTNTNKLCSSGYSLLSVFQRGICKNTRIEDGQDRILNIHVCPQCTASCDACQPLDKNTESLDGYDLVYYLHPAHDKRNWGGFIDFNVNKTCNYPKLGDFPVQKARTSIKNEKENTVPNGRTVANANKRRKNDTPSKPQREAKKPCNLKTRPQRRCKKNTYTEFFTPLVTEELDGAFKKKASRK